MGPADGGSGNYLANNAADTWLHVAIAAVSLLLGFAVKEAPHPVGPVGPARPAT